MHRRTLLTFLLFAIAGVLLPLGSAAQTTDDTALFSTAVPPNVMLQVDNSGSMHNVVWHPTYDPTSNPTCNFFQDGTTYNVRSTYTDVTLNGGTDTTFKAQAYTLASTGCVTTPRLIFDDPVVTASGSSTRWTGHYLNWLFSPASNAVYSDVVSSNNGTWSSCVGGGTYSLYKRSRISASKNVLQEVICQVNASGAVRFGMAQYRRGGDPNGGYVTVPIEDYLDNTGNPNVYTLDGVSQSHGQHLDDAIQSLTGEAWTPLAETLFQVYTYFMSRTAADRPPAATSGTFPEYTYKADIHTARSGAHSTSGAPVVPDSPVQFPCQKNFVIVITDGEPTKDDFDTETPTNTANGFANFGTLIGDYNPDAEVETGYGSEGALYLDDVAKFMQEVDFRPDMVDQNGFPQVIDVYTVGFTTSPAANALLAKTAAQGNGQFYFSNDPQKLAADIIAAVSDIIQKSQSFTAATVPAARTAAGGKFYTSLFVPSDQDSFWEGHLRSWDIDVKGHILDSGGLCAVNDPEQPNECSLGSFKSTATPFWDSGNVLTARNPATRQLFTTRLTGAIGSTKVRFDDATITPTDLALTAADIPTYNYGANPVPANATALKTVVVDNIRGCELGQSGAGCVKRPWLLGDIFHSDPVVVPGPPAGLAESGHGGFHATYATRQKMIIAGANDGFLRFFDAGTWQTSTTPPAYNNGTGDEVIGFMPYPVRQNAKELARDSGARDFYTVDGSPRVSDSWFYTNPTINTQLASGSEWRTVLVSGMRQGGRSFYALDISNPSATASTTCPNTRSNPDAGYPCYLWEFPREDATAAIKSMMGETWSEPVIGKIRVKVNANDNGGAGFDRWVAVVGTGFDRKSDPNDYASYDALATEGRALLIIDVQTGEIIAKKEFDPTTTAASTTDPTSVAYDPLNPERSMHYAMAGTPGVFDLDTDGYIDTIYMADLGGNIWKWVVKGIGHDSVNSSTTDYDQNSTWKFSKFFEAPSHFDAVASVRRWKSFFFAPTAVLDSGKLWVTVGSGERTHLQYMGDPLTTAENNRLYSVVDSDPFNSLGTASALVETDLVDLTTPLGATQCASVTGKKGFFIMGQDGEKFITPTDIFFFVTFAASYVPTVAANPCDATGDAYLYAFSVQCGEGLFTDAGTGNPVTNVSLGSGLPTAPKITMSLDPSGKSSIVINNQNGDLIDPSRPKCTTPPCKPSCDKATNPDCPLPQGFKGVGQMYWREF